MAEKWIQKAISKPGALKKALHVPEGKTIPASKLKIKESLTQNTFIKITMPLAFSISHSNLDLSCENSAFDCTYERWRYRQVFNDAGCRLKLKWL